jgi:hypothetical protein
MSKLITLTSQAALLVLVSVIFANPSLAEEVVTEKDLKPVIIPQGRANNLRGLNQVNATDWNWQVSEENPNFLELEKEDNIFKQILPSQVYNTFFDEQSEPIEVDWKKANQGDYQRFTPSFSLPVYNY